MLKEVIITEDEKKALEDYQDNYYKIINTLLRRGTTSEQTINSKNGKDYVAPSNEELEKALENMGHIYSAIIKSTLINGNSIETKPLYRGTQISLIEQMRRSGEETSFLSTTTNKNQTRAFSRTFSKDKSIDTEYDKAFLKVEGNVPHINLEELLGGMEDEIIFVPARAEIVEGIDGISVDDEKHTKMYGKPYTLKLTPLEIPEMAEQDIAILRKSILARNEQMGKVINTIIKMQQSPNLFDTSNLTSLIEQYSKWKDDIITYCHQEFRIIQKELGFNNSKGNNYNEKEVMGENGYNIESKGKSYIEHQQQVLKDVEGNEIGNRTITWNTDIQNGIESIETVGILENSDGKYSMKENSKTLGGELQLHRKELINQNKNIREQEHFVYQKDGKGNETYFRTVNGKLTCKIVKNEKGFTIDTFDKGQPLDTFEYDKDGTAIYGMPGIDTLESDYVAHFFDSHVPYFEAENRMINMQQTQIVDTQKLGRETLAEQSDTTTKDTVESYIETQMRTNTRGQQPQQTYQEQPETKTHSTENPESFRSKMKFKMTEDQYQEILDRQTAAEENFAKEMAENPENKKTEQAEYGVK